MKPPITITFGTPLPSIQARSKQYRQLSQHCVQAGKDARQVAEGAREKAAFSKLRWQQAQQRYQQLEFHLASRRETSEQVYPPIK